MADEPNPTLARRELASVLRRAREQAERTPEQLASFLGVSLPQASRLDSGARGYQPKDVRKLVGWYDLGAAESRRLLELATEARKRAWWQQTDLPDAYRTLIGLEGAAVDIAEYATSFVPGLLQTAAYARTQIRSFDASYPDEIIDRAVEVRLRRQEVLSRAPAPRLWVVIDEVALARAPLDPDIRRAQFDHLLVMSKRPGVTIQVIGLEVGLHPGIGKHLILLGMGARVPDIAYTEALIEPAIFEQEDEVAVYRRLWDELHDVALRPADSRARIAAYLP